MQYQDVERLKIYISTRILLYTKFLSQVYRRPKPFQQYIVRIQGKVGGDGRIVATGQGK